MVAAIEHKNVVQTHNNSVKSCFKSSLLSLPSVKYENVILWVNKKKVMIINIDLVTYKNYLVIRWIKIKLDFNACASQLNEHKHNTIKKMQPLRDSNLQLNMKYVLNVSISLFKSQWCTRTFEVAIISLLWKN